jgi:hypothetical protein
MSLTGGAPNEDVNLARFLSEFPLILTKGIADRSRKKSGDIILTRDGLIKVTFVHVQSESLCICGETNLEVQVRATSRLLEA